jgi:hypothetical protein
MVICLPFQLTGPLAYRPIAEDEELLRRAADNLFPRDTADVFVPMFAARDLASWFDEAHRVLLNHGSFGTTQLARLLPELLRNASSAAFWWGNDWLDLPKIIDEEDAIRLIVDGLSGPVGEVYAQWHFTGPPDSRRDCGVTPGSHLRSF